MRPWLLRLHIWPSLWPLISSTTETDAHAHSIRQQRPATVAPSAFYPQNRQSATACVAQSKTTAPLGLSKSNAPVESETHSAGVWPPRLAPACPCASAQYPVPHEWWYCAGPSPD